MSDLETRQAIIAQLKSINDNTANENSERLIAVLTTLLALDFDKVNEVSIDYKVITDADGDPIDVYPKINIKMK